MGEKKNSELGNAAAEMGKSALSFLRTAKKSIVKAIDQTGDGEFNMEDVNKIAGDIGTTFQKTFSSIKDNWDKQSKEKELQ